MSQLASSLDRDSVAAIRAGDYSAFDSVFCAFADPLAAYACRLLRSPEDARDVVHDLFLWIWEHREEWEVPGTLKTYLYSAIRNRALSQLRHRKVEWVFRHGRTKHAAAPLAIVAPLSTQRIEAGELSSLIDRAIEALPDRCRQVFLLNRQHHLSYSEIAEVLHLSPKTVENHMARAMAGMRKALEEWP